MRKLRDRKTKESAPELCICHIVLLVDVGSFQKDHNIKAFMSENGISLNILKSESALQILRSWITKNK